MAETLPLTDRITSKSKMSQENRNLEAQFGNGQVQKVPDGLNHTIDKWFLEFAPVEGDNLVTMNAFLNTVGTTEWFAWTPLGELAVKKWTIDKNSVKRLMINTEKFVIQFNITQNFTLGVI